MFFILLVIFHGCFIKAVNHNYSIGLKKCAQGTSLSNREKEYLERAADVVSRAVKVSKVKELNSKEDDTGLDCDPIIDLPSFDQLDLISSTGKGLFYPEDIKKMSYGGKAFLAYLATAQTNDSEVLKKRQLIIEYLQKNPDFKKELLKILALLETNTEEAFLDLKKELTKAEKSKQNKFFFRLK